MDKLLLKNATKIQIQIDNYQFRYGDDCDVEPFEAAFCFLFIRKFWNVIFAIIIFSIENKRLFLLLLIYQKPNILYIVYVFEKLKLEKITCSFCFTSELALALELFSLRRKAASRSRRSRCCCSSAAAAMRCSRNSWNTPFESAANYR